MEEELKIHFMWGKHCNQTHFRQPLNIAHSILSFKMLLDSPMTLVRLSLALILSEFKLRV